MLNEADTRAKLIDPAIHQRGWSEDMICREVTQGAIEIVAGRARRRAGGRMDYTLRVRLNGETQPVAVALMIRWLLASWLANVSGSQSRCFTRTQPIFPVERA